MGKPPAFVRALQSVSIVLDPKEHQKHHHDPFDTNYTITNGWLNPLFQRLQFWKRAEEFCTRVFGWEPRADDAFWRKATGEQKKYVPPGMKGEMNLPNGFL